MVGVSNPGSWTVEQDPIVRREVVAVAAIGEVDSQECSNNLKLSQESLWLHLGRDPQINNSPKPPGRSQILLPEASVLPAVGRERSLSMSSMIVPLPQVLEQKNKQLESGGNGLGQGSKR